MSLNVLYEDNHVIVVEKPCNVLVQADNTGDVDMLTLVKKYLKVKYDKPGDVYLGLVHRLDRPVGGVMVFARTSKAASRLSNQVRTHGVEKKYLAVVKIGFDTPHNEWSELVHYIEKNTETNKVKISKEMFGNAKQAILKYRILETVGNLALVEVNLITGRTHQIRAQMSAIGCPIYGDNKYGEGIAGEQIALWAYSLEFEHPTKKERQKFICLPKNFYPWDQFKLPES